MASFFDGLKQLFSNDNEKKLPPVKTETLLEKHARYRQDALKFDKQKHQEQSRKQNALEDWYRRYGRRKTSELSQLSGIEFEQYLAGLFRQLGYQVELTPKSGDYGADLLLDKLGERIAIQAKCYTGSVGVAAVQEALSGMAYYHCQTAWVVTTGNYTPNAIELAKKSKVRLLGTTELGKLIKQLEDNGISHYG